MWKQIACVVLVNLSSLWQRRSASSVIVVGMGVVAAVLATLLAMANGFSDVLAARGRTDRVIVLGGGASAELISGITRSAAATILDAPGIRRDAANRPLASPETLMLVTLNLANGARATSAVLRGMSQRGLSVRPELQISAGRMLTPGLRELIVGKAAQRLYRGLQVGERISLRGTEWLIVGAFTSGGSVHESELIADVDALMSAYARDVYQSIVAVLEPNTSAAQFATTLAGFPALRTEVEAERTFYLRQAKTVNDLLSFVIFVVGGFMAVGALFAALNTMYSAVSARTSEIATLRAIGFAPVAVVASVFTEAILLALCGAAVGVLGAWLLFGGSMVSSTGSSVGGQVAFDIRVSWPVVTAALQFALLIAILGALTPALRAARMRVADSLRKA